MHVLLRVLQKPEGRHSKAELIAQAELVVWSTAKPKTKFGFAEARGQVTTWYLVCLSISDDPTKKDRFVPVQSCMFFLSYFLLQRHEVYFFDPLPRITPHTLVA